MCCCQSCREKIYPTLSKSEMVKELEGLKHIVNYFPVETTMNGERMCFDSVEQIQEKINQL